MTTEILKNAKISQAIINQIAAGKSIVEAVDAVLGAGTFRKIADTAYDSYIALASK